MPTINSSASKDGYVQSYLESSWAGLRQRTDAQWGVDADNERDANAIILFHNVGMRGTVFGMVRAFFAFDTSGVTGTPESATLNIRGFSNDSSDLIAVATDYMPSLTTADWQAIAGAEEEFALSDGIGGGTLSGATGVKVYSEKFTSWSTSGYNQVDITAAGLAAMKDLDDWEFCLMDYDYDFLDIEPPAAVASTGLYWGDNSTYPPYIDYTVAGAAVTHNATFFGTNF